jgi:hypothetical protein
MDAGVEPLRYDRMQWATLIRQTMQDQANTLEKDGLIPQ